VNETTGCAVSCVRCEICGTLGPAWGDVAYPRVPFARPTVHVRSLKRCVACVRRGCPSCLCALEERVEDFVFDVFLCYRCLGLHAPRVPPGHPEQKAGGES
jgi:hypothetical protein